MDNIDLLCAAADAAFILDPKILERAHANREDRFKGALVGVAVGDAAGAPHEFSRTGFPVYTGRIEHRVFVHHRWTNGPPLACALGTVTDDTEMTIALARAIIAGRGILMRNIVIDAYLRWAGSRPPGMGKNTRALFMGIKTIAGYESRRAAVIVSSESNGCLMRASPLAMLSEHAWRAAVVLDCSLSNWNPVCILSVMSYIAALRILISGGTAAAASAAALIVTSDAETDAAAAIVRAVVEAGRDGLARNVTGVTKGWVLHALYCAFYALNRIGSFEDRIDEIIRMGGDTDTNAAIAGAVLGAQLGFASMSQETRTGANIAIVLGCDTVGTGVVRPDLYSARHLPQLAQQLNDCTFGL